MPVSKTDFDNYYRDIYGEKSWSAGAPIPELNENSDMIFRNEKVRIDNCFFIVRVQECKTDIGLHTCSALNRNEYILFFPFDLCEVFLFIADGMRF